MNRTLLIIIGISYAVITACLPLGMAAGCSSTQNELPTQSPTERENRLLQTTEWQSFNKAWNDFREFKTHGKSGSYHDQKGALLEDAKEKALILKRLEPKNLISEAEIKAIEEFIKAVKNYDIGTVFPPFQVDAVDVKEYWLGGQVLRKMAIIKTSHLSKQEKEIEGHFPIAEQERAAYFLKENIPLIEEIARQPDFLEWIKEHFIRLLIKPKFKVFNLEVENFVVHEANINGKSEKHIFEDVKLLTPNFVKCWERPMNWDEVVQLKERVQKALMTIEMK